MIYEYYCDICGFELELQQKVNDPSPYCSHSFSDVHIEDAPSVMKRKISKTSFTLAGSGWYRDRIFER